MKNLRLNKIFDFLFFVSATFLIVLVWVRYFLHDLIAILFTSGLITFAITSLYHIFFKKKEDKKNSNIKEMQNAEKISVDFLLSTKNEIMKIFYEKFNVKYNTKQKSDYLFVNDKILKPIYSSQKITDKDIMESYLKIKNLACKKMIITCYEADENCYDFLKLIENMEIVILTKYDAYENIFKPLKFEIPEQKIIKKQKNLNLYLSIAFNKKRTKNYAVVSLFLFFSSFVFRYNIYYLIFSSITGILALYSHFNLRWNKQQKTQYIE